MRYARDTDGEVDKSHMGIYSSSLKTPYVTNADRTGGGIKTRAMFVKD
jgi:hypothetical protein